MGGSAQGKKGKGKGKSVPKKADGANKSPGRSSSGSDLGHTKTDNQNSFPKQRERSLYVNICAEEGKGKGKSVPKKADGANRSPGQSSSGSDLGHTKTDNQNSFPKQRERSLYVNINADVSRWRNYTNDELEKLLHLKLELIYAEAHLKLLDLGYERDIAEHAILMNGHGLGYMNIFSNIVTNSICYINSDCVTDKTAPHGCSDMNKRVKSLLVWLVKLLQKGQPTWDKSYAMKYLLAIDIGVDVATAMYPQSVSSKHDDDSGIPVDMSSGEVQDFGPGETSSLNMYDPSTQNSNALMHKDPLFFNKLVDLTKRNAQTYAEVHNDMKDSPTYSEALCNGLAGEEPDLEEADLIRLVEGNPDDARDELLASLSEELRGLKEQVREQKEWALEKGKKAEESIKHHIAELFTARAENMYYSQMLLDTDLLLAKNNMTICDTQLKLMDAQNQVNRASEVSRQLEIENAEIRADVEALHLSTSETIRTAQEVEKRTSRHLKRVATTEKEIRKLQIDIEEQKLIVEQLNQEMIQLNLSLEDAEAKLKEQLKEKELAVALVKEEEKLLKIAESSLMRSKQVSLQQKVESRQWMKDDIAMLEKELAHLRISQSVTFGNACPESFNLHDRPEEKLFSDRACVVCLKLEASILFLPCAHQVVCSTCNEKILVGAVCPCCLVQIEQKFQVYGTSS